MSRDDYISKLFIDNEHKLEELPPSDLWGRIETQLEEPVSVENPKQEAHAVSLERKTSSTARILRLAPYVAAASVLLVVLFYFGRSENESIKADQKALAMESKSMPALEDVLIDIDATVEELPINTSEIKEKNEEKDKAQKAKIEKLAAAEVAKTYAVQPKTIDLKNVEIKEKSNDVILLTAEKDIDIEVEKPRLKQKMTIEQAEPGNFAISNTNFSPTVNNGANFEPSEEKQLSDYKFDNLANNQLYDEYKGRAYAVPPSADFNEEQKTSTIGRQKYQSKSKTRRKTKGKGSIRARKNAKTNTRNKQYLHPRLEMFQWILGKWIDDGIQGGTSYETWTWVNPNEISGNGLKLKNNQQIFAEQFTIYVDPKVNQVFLKMQLTDDASRKFLYMLSSFDTDGIVFTQQEDKNLPTKVIIQRTMDGYRTIIDHEYGFINTDQQGYLNNRNRVSNVRAIRNMRAVE